MTAGIVAAGNLAIQDCTITSNGISSGDSTSAKNITINSGTVTSTTRGLYGINAQNGTVTIGEGVKLTAVGDTQAITGTVINNVAGTGWSNTEGTDDKTDIGINTSGAALTYRKVQFPASDEYPLWVGTTRVSESNKDDILGNSAASYDPDTNILTLNGVSIDITHGGLASDHGIYYAGSDPLIIELALDSDNRINTSISTGFGHGIYSKKAAISIIGDGELTINQARGFGINIDEPGQDINIGSTTVSIKAANGGIASTGNVLITNSTVYAEETLTQTYGYSLSAIHASNSVIIENSDVYAKADSDAGKGISAKSDVTIDKASSLTAIGKGQAISGTVKNMIDGTGWDNIAGTGKGDEIPISSDGQDLTRYKMVQLPVVSGDDYTYYCSKGDKQEWTRGSGTDLSFTFDRSPAGDVFTNRNHIEIDGKVVAESSYDESEGSWVVRLKSSYLEQLSIGRHTIEAVFTDYDGTPATAAFTIVEKAAPAPSGKPASSGNPSPSGGYYIPNTEDSFHSEFWILSLAVSSLLALFCIRTLKKYA